MGAAALGAAGAAASPVWLEPVNLTPGYQGSDAWVAMTSGGDAIVVWRTDSRELKAAVRPAGAAFEAPQVIDSGDGFADVAIATDQLGNATLTWSAAGTIKV